MERNSPVDEAALWSRLKASDDKAARERLIELYLPYAKLLAGRYRAATEPSEDLVQVACIGLVKAVDRFDIDRGVPFQGFAAPTILGELKRHFRDRVWTVRVPRSLHDRIADVEAASAELRADLRRSPSVREIAEHLGIPSMDVLEALEANQNRRAASLDQPVGSEDEGDATLIERIGSDDDALELMEQRIAVEGEIPKLGALELTVLRLRFVEDLTQSQIADQVGYSQMHVSRVLSRTLSAIRDGIGEFDESASPGESKDDVSP